MKTFPLYYDEDDFSNWSTKDKNEEKPCPILPFIDPLLDWFHIIPTNAIFRTQYPTLISAPEQLALMS